MKVLLVELASLVIRCCCNLNRLTKMVMLAIQVINCNNGEIEEVGGLKLDPIEIVFVTPQPLTGSKPVTV